MDNFTHALAGLLTAELALALPDRKPAAKLPGFRAAACATAALANNLPDLDFVYVSVTGGKLGYLLHHRGHTHTLIAALPCALLVLGVVTVASGARRKSWDRAAWLTLAALALVGPLCHIAMDFSNNYGVHPFWPFDDSWYYGDVVFIVEPWFWVATLPALLHLAESRVARALYALFIGGMVVAAWVARPIPWLGALTLSVGVVGALLALRGRRRATQALAGLAASLAVLAVFGLAGNAARREVAQRVASDFGPSELLDVVMTPAPSVPLCWSAIALSVEGERYVARSARVSALPFALSAAACPEANVGKTASLSPITAAPSRSLVWDGQFTAQRAALKALFDRCDAHAFLRFARAPFWRDVAEPRLVGDLRYDRNVGLDFAEMPLAAEPRCPEHVPSWTPPRLDAVP